MKMYRILAKNWLVALLLCLPAVVGTLQSVALEMPDTGISGVYEVAVSTDEARPLLDHFSAFGFEVIAEGRWEAAEAKAMYGIDSGFRSWRLQNGKISSHGLLRIIEWDRLGGPGVGYTPPHTIGMRLSVMRTQDIVRIADVFADMWRADQPWLVLGPVFDDLYDLGEGGPPSILNRRVGVREMSVIGPFFTHVFFQRYGYAIPGYGTIGDGPLQTSEFTHHDFIILGDVDELTRHYTEVLGFKRESEPTVAGDWLKGPREVFGLKPGVSHHYLGLVSPNNICGKLKFFVPVDPNLDADRSDRVGIDRPGISLHSLYTPKLHMVHRLATDHGLSPTAILANEFGEQSFVFTGPDGASWQIIAKSDPQPAPLRELHLEKADN